MTSLRYYPIFALGAAAAIVGYALLSRKPKRSSDWLEHERRTRLARGGRIIDGTVIDVHELEETETRHQMLLLIYTYDVAGVSYQASQDVTHLRQFIDLYSCRLGLPASVKYDPHNPGRFHRHLRATGQDSANRRSEQPPASCKLVPTSVRPLYPARHQNSAHLGSSQGLTL